MTIKVLDDKIIGEYFSTYDGQKTKTRLEMVGIN